MSLIRKLKNFAAAGLVGIVSCGDLQVIERQLYYPSAVEVYQSENIESPESALQIFDNASALVYPGGKITIRFDNPLWGLFPTSIYANNRNGECSNLEINAIELENKTIKQKISAASIKICQKGSYEISLGKAVKSSQYKTNAIEIINHGPDVFRLDAIEEFMPI